MSDMSIRLETNINYYSTIYVSYGIKFAEKYAKYKDISDFPSKKCLNIFENWPDKTNKPERSLKPFREKYSEYLFFILTETIFFGIIYMINIL